MADFRKLHVWRKAHAMAVAAHRVAGRIRRRDHAPLKTQLIRSAMSVPTNIVEGRAQKSDREFGRFLKMALGSATELEYHLILGDEVGAISHEDFQSMLDQVVDVKKMLTGLLGRLEREKRPAAGKAASNQQNAASS
jgi:four helix bundle protein